MKLIDYLRTSCETVGEEKPASILYYFRDDKKGYETEDFSISDSILCLEGDVSIPLATEGTLTSDCIWQCELNGDKIGLEFYF
jgi:hypothetical protein